LALVRKYTEKEKVHLLTLYSSVKGRKMLSCAFDEGWKAAAGEKGADWDSRSCFMQIVKKSGADRDTINENIY